MFKAEYWMISTLFAVGVIAGLSYLLVTDSAGSHSVSSLEHEEPQEEPTRDENAEAGKNGLPVDKEARFDEGRFKTTDGAKSDFEPNPAVIASNLIQEGDSYLLLGNYELAARRYQFAQQATGIVSNEVSLRQAFCAEYAGKQKSAAEFYNRVVQSRPTETQRWVALSGLARTWIERGNRQEALLILSELFLESLGQDAMPTAIRTQIVYQMGVAFQDVALEKYHHDLAKPDGVSFHPISPWIEELMQLILPKTETGNITGVNDKSTEARPSDQSQVSSLEISKPTSTVGGDKPEPSLPDDPPKVTILQHPDDSIDSTTVNLETPFVPIIDLCGHLVAACDLELLASPAAKAAIAGRAKKISAQDVNASLLLDSILLPFNVIWFQEEKRIYLLEANESVDHRSKFFALAMDRMFRRLAAVFANDYRVSGAILARGNMKVIEGDLNRGAMHYQELLLRNPTNELLAEVFFNIGKIEMRLGRNDQAVRNFYLTVDQTYHTHLQSMAYWSISQLSLEMRQLPEAIKTGGRALGLAKTDDHRRLAALTLSRAYLVSNQPLSANQVLFENRFSFEGSSFETTAAVIGSLARYRGMTNQTNLDTESARLLTAISNVNLKNVDSFLDLYIVARAWLELGFRDKAIEYLTLAADSTTISSWRRQFLFELAVQLTIGNQQERAIPVFEFLVTGEADEWIEKSMLQLIQLYVSQERTDDSLKMCEQLLSRELEFKDKQLILQVMGTAYRQKGEHHSAALCFAGMIPSRAKEERKFQ